MHTNSWFQTPPDQDPPVIVIPIAGYGNDYQVSSSMLWAPSNEVCYLLFCSLCHSYPFILSSSSPLSEFASRSLLSSTPLLTVRLQADENLDGDDDGDDHGDFGDDDNGIDDDDDGGGTGGMQEKGKEEATYFSHVIP